MKELELKERFIEFLKTNPNHNLLGNDINQTKRIIEIKNEALNKRFDFILAEVKSRNLNVKKIKNQTIDIDDDLKNIFTRNHLVQKISREYKIRIQDFVIYPIEIKSDHDKLDSRLANQIIEAILSFGRSVIILDNKHAQKIIKNGLKNILPSRIIGYIQSENKFILLNDYKRVFADSLLKVNKINLIKILQNSNINTDVNYSALSKNLNRIQQINQKIIYNQIFNNDYILLDEEINFVKKLSLLDQNLSLKREIIKSIKSSNNYRITDFID